MPLDPDDDELHFPIAYVRSLPNDPVTMQVDLELSFGGNVDTDWLVRGSGGGLNFTLVGDIAAAGAGITATLAANAQLGETIDSRMLKIDWEVSLNNRRQLVPRRPNRKPPVRHRQHGGDGRV
jgi:hypothetical protein